MDLLIAFLAALAAGMINAVAGGGTLVSFPVLVAMGLPPVTANITNTLSLCPGYFGGIFAQRKELPAHRGRMSLILPVSIIGGLIGGMILIHSSEQSFEIVIPYLILAASLLLAVQGRLKQWMKTRQEQKGFGRMHTTGGLLLLFLSSVYGGYFGAGVSVIVIAVLGLMYDDSLTSLNVLKQAVSFCVNITAALYFACTGRVEWLLVLVMCVGSVAGGYAGGSLVERIHSEQLRWFVVAVGLVVAAWYLFV